MRYTGMMLMNPRGFNLYDTDTQELTQVDNPHKMFHLVYYNDTPHQLVDTSKYKDKIIKLSLIHI